ncbi:sodium-coupled monocarboxylate transporter 1-like [Periplaneta americana]|uniref:sodium-coupled monocarboxylate transporter 1-like n=1 Tax=Periplaneta americana TaxID=6978 RepID=UPI0037E7120C
MTMNVTTDFEEGAKALFFSWLDFTLFILMLVVSTLIGIYFGFWGKKEDTPKEYLHGGKTMNTMPVAVSLVSSIISGITVMGAPSEIYMYGTLYWLVCVSAVLIGFINNYIYLPVFYELQLTSTYEYLQLRFNKQVRVMASVLYTIGLLLNIPIVVYVPALAFSQVSGVNIHIITVAVSVLCIFYTMLGGLKAVVWTDFLQGLVMVVASIAVIILGLIQEGSFGAVWNKNDIGGRIRFFEMTPSPTVRMSFWIVIIGHTILWINVVSVNQAMVQKFMSLPTYRQAQKALVIAVAGLLVTKFISCFTGLLIYAAYKDCDPLTSKAISRPDQLLPYYVMDISKSVPGLPGLFVAGIFSASLSTMSSSLNALGATLFEDFVRPCMKKTLSDRTASNIIKCVVVVIGAICVLIVFIVDKMGSILQLAFSALGVTAGAMIGLFTFGMLYPPGNAKGALAGSIFSLLFMSWIVIGNRKGIAEGKIKLPLLPTSVEGCAYNFTLPEPTPTPELDEEEVFVLYRVTFMYYSLMGMVVMMVVGAAVSFFTQSKTDEKMNPALFSPFVRKYFLKAESRNKEPASSKLLEFQTANGNKLETIQT